MTYLVLRICYTHYSFAEDIQCMHPDVLVRRIVLRLHSLICHILKPKINRPDSRKLRVTNLWKKKKYGTSENWNLKYKNKKFSTNSLFFQLIILFLFVLSKRVKALEHEYICSKHSRNFNISGIFWACYTKNNFPIIFPKYKKSHFLASIEI